MKSFTDLCFTFFASVLKMIFAACSEIVNVSKLLLITHDPKNGAFEIVSSPTIVLNNSCFDAWYSFDSKIFFASHIFSCP